MSHDDFEVEPIPGLPSRPPEGELVLWQGSPDWKTFAVNVFHLRKIALYLGVLVLWQVAVSINDGHTTVETISRGMVFTVLAGIALAIVAGAARLYAKSCIYTITSRRIVIRHGVALPVTVTIPFKLIDKADLQLLPRGRGNIAVALHEGSHASLIALWPSTRPWRWLKPEPSFRAVPNAENVARLLARAIAQTVEGEVMTVVPERVTKNPVEPFAGAAAA